MSRVHRNVAERRRARWMGSAMLVLAGIVPGTPAGADMVEIPAWRNSFVSQGVSGTIVVRRLGEKRSFVSDLDGAERGLSPAATFKIPHLLIALETGVVRDLDRVHRRDGQPYRVAAWDHELTTGQAVDTSSVSVFQSIARSIGPDRMAAWLAKIGYGWAELSGGIDRFWLDGGLKVTPSQQVDFVERMLLGTLPASTRSQVVARDAVPGEMLACDVAIRGKTGWSHVHGEDGPDVGWWVGWVERPREVWLFATAVEGHPDRIREARRAVTLAVLSATGIAPDGSAGGNCGRPASLPDTNSALAAAAD